MAPRKEGWMAYRSRFGRTCRMLRPSSLPRRAGAVPPPQRLPALASLLKQARELEWNHLGEVDVPLHKIVKK